ncbi:transposase family protein [Streptomyces hirsutus]
MPDETLFASACRQVGIRPWVGAVRSGRRPPGDRPPASSAHRRRTQPTRRTVNRALARSRAPVERGMARLKSWRIFRRSRITPNRMTSIAAANFSPWRRC